MAFKDLTILLLFSNQYNVIIGEAFIKYDEGEHCSTMVAVSIWGQGGKDPVGYQMINEDWRLKTKAFKGTQPVVLTQI